MNKKRKRSAGGGEEARKEWQKTRKQGQEHRVGRVLSFFSSRRNQDSLAPSPAGRGKERESGWGSPNSDEGTYTVKKDVQRQYSITLLVDSAFTLNIYDFIFFRPIFPARVNFWQSFRFSFLNVRYMNLDSHRLGEIGKFTKKNFVQANLLLKTPPQSPKRREDFSSGEILNGQGNMEYHAGTRQVNIKNIDVYRPANDLHTRQLEYDCFIHLK